MVGDSIRFGVRRGTLRSGTFVVASSVNTPDIYIVCRAVGSQAKISLHQSNSWRHNVKPISAETGEVMPPIGGDTWTRPPPFAPGLTKVFGIIVPAAGITLPITPADDDVQLLPMPREAWGIQFTLVLSAPGAPVRSWPGADGMSTTLVGNVTLANEETLWVVAHEIANSPMADGTSLTVQLLPGQDMEVVKAAMAAGTFRTLALVIDDLDGMRSFMETAVVPK